MTTHGEIMRRLMEASEYKGPLDHPDVSYSSESKKGEITKVIARLSSYQSGRYTRLGRNLKRIEWLEAKIKQIKDEVKGETKEMIADLFHADDVVRTRVVETVSFTFELTKNPKPADTVQYAKVLEELENHLTPELIGMLTEIKAKYTKSVIKSPSLTARDHALESQLREGLWDTLRGVFAKFLQRVTQWGQQYDSQLNALRAQVGLHETRMVDEASQPDQLNQLFRVFNNSLQGSKEFTVVRVNARGDQFVVKSISDERVYRVGISESTGTVNVAESVTGHGNLTNKLFKWIWNNTDDLERLGFDIVSGARDIINLHHTASGRKFSLKIIEKTPETQIASGLADRIGQTMQEQVINEAPPAYYDDPVNMLAEWLFEDHHEELPELGFAVMGRTANRISVRHLQTGETLVVTVSRQTPKA